MLRTRLTFGLLPLLLLFLAVCLYAYRTSHELGAAAGDLLAWSFRSIQVEQAMREDAGRMREALSVTNRGEAADASRRFEEARAHFKRRLNDELLNQPGAERGA